MHTNEKKKGRVCEGVKMVCGRIRTGIKAEIFKTVYRDFEGGDRR